VVAAGLGVILSAVYMLWMFQRVYLGPVTHDENETLSDLRPREWASVVPLCALAIVMGVFPTVFLAPMEASVQRVVARVQSVQPLRVQNTEGQRAKVKGQRATVKGQRATVKGQTSGQVAPVTFDF
jgi:NADH:ubiquinone oxidoreductase subunit 4 (subunit M)